MFEKKFRREIYLLLPAPAAVIPLVVAAAHPVPEKLLSLWCLLFCVSLLFVPAVFFLPCLKVGAAGKRLLFCTCIGFSVAAVFTVRFASSRDTFGADPRRLTEWRGVLTADSRRMDYGRTGYNVRCRKASGGGVTVSVDCNMFFTVKEGPKLRKGQPAVFKGVHRGNYFRVESVAADGVLPPLWAFRARILDRLTETFFIEETVSGAFFEALFSGDRDDLNSVMTEVFRKSGCLHLIALSGMHLGILVSLCRMTAGRIFPEKYLNALLIPLLGFYVILTGSAPSLKRAYVMFVISAFGGFFGVRLPPGDVLCVTLMINALLYPQEVLHPGMRLSFAAVFGIVFFSRRLQTSLCRCLPKAAAAPLAVSYAAQIGVAPFLFAADGVNPAGILASIAASPLLALFMYIRFSASAVALAGTDAAALGIARLSDFVCDMVVSPLVFFAGVPTLPFLPYGFLFFVPFAVIVCAEWSSVFLRRLFFIRKKDKVKQEGVSCD